MRFQIRKPNELGALQGRPRYECPFSAAASGHRPASCGKDLYQPYWSSKILEELERVLVRVGNLAPDAARRVRAEITRAFPEASIEGFEHLEPAMANDPADRHVAAAATLVGAQVIATANVRHFSGLPQSLGIQTPDAFLMGLLGLAPTQMDAILREIQSDYRNPLQDVSALLSRLGAVAPNFKAAMEVRLQP
jgi:PIN domain